MSTQIRFYVAGHDPRELTEMAHGVCRDVFKAGPNSYEPYALMRIGPAYPDDQEHIGLTRWRADYVAGSQMDTDALQKYIETCIASRTLGI